MLKYQQKPTFQERSVCLKRLLKEDGELWILETEKTEVIAENLEMEKGVEMENVETEKLKRQICNELFERDYTLLSE